MNHKSDWYEKVVGDGNVNEGLARMMGAILAFIVVFGAIFWAI
ncbi:MULTISPECIES: hypothetical protein [unclassified Rhizobium]